VVQSCARALWSSVTFCDQPGTVNSVPSIAVLYHRGTKRASAHCVFADSMPRTSGRRTAATGGAPQDAMAIGVQATVGLQPLLRISIHNRLLASALQKGAGSVSDHSHHFPLFARAVRSILPLHCHFAFKTGNVSEELSRQAGRADRPARPAPLDIRVTDQASIFSRIASRAPQLGTV